MFTSANLSLLLDRLRRQALDVVTPVLVLIAAGQVAGVDLASVGGVLFGGAIVTALSWLVGLSPTRWWERLVWTVAGSVLAVCGADWNGWLKLDAKATLIAIAGSVALSLLRSWSSSVRTE